MYDATGKLGSGVLRGNSAQLGDYDGCVEISESQNDIQGQYCLASLFLDKRNSSKLDQNVLDLIQSHRAMHSTPDDVCILYSYFQHNFIYGNVCTGLQLLICTTVEVFMKL